MSQITIYLNDDALQNLKKLSNASGKSISKISSEMIENAINIQQEHQKNAGDIAVKKMSEHEKNHYVSVSVALNLIFESFKKLNNEPSKYDGKTAMDIINDSQDLALEKLKDL